MSSLKNIESYAIVALIAFILGGMLAFTVTYPVQIQDIHHAEQICSANKEGAIAIRVRITGKIAEVTCADKISFKLD
jgi:prolipoprotein diacylglyceryltransferase